jgi:hypothetical protein
MKKEQPNATVIGPIAAVVWVNPWQTPEIDIK